LAGLGHICAFFATREEQYQSLLPFVQEGIVRGEKAFHVVDPALRADHLSRLEAAGVDVRRAEASGQLEVRTWEQTYLQDRRFDPGAVLARFKRILEEARDRGFPLTRLITYMEWGRRDRPEASDLLEYEARASALLERYDDHVVCVYDRARFGTELAMDIARAHPMVISAGMLLENPSFVAPDAFLEELAARGGAPVDRPRRRFTARCVHCKRAILAGVARIGDEETHVLREHLRACRPAVPMDRHRDEQLGRLLSNYELAEE
jgi:hypothetical protein